MAQPVTRAFQRYSDSTTGKADAESFEAGWDARQQFEYESAIQISAKHELMGLLAVLFGLSGVMAVLANLTVGTYPWVFYIGLLLILGAVLMFFRYFDAMTDADRRYKDRWS